MLRSLVRFQRESPTPVSGSQDRGVHDVVAGLLVDADKVLLCHRSARRRWYPSVWDLPGGHVEQNEAPAVALVRELYEELGILVPEPTDAAFAHLRRPDYECRIWVVREWSGSPHLASEEHDDLAWWLPSAIDDLALADDSYRPLLKRAVSRFGD
jgi:8-oxo-dGTP diphosphatase